MVKPVKLNDSDCPDCLHSKHDYHMKAFGGCYYKQDGKRCKCKKNYD